MGPVIVAVHCRRFSGDDGKAEMPGVGCSIRFISSVWSLMEAMSKMYILAQSRIHTFS